MLESVQVHRMTGPTSDLYWMNWTDLTGHWWRFDRIIDHNEVHFLWSVQSNTNEDIDDVHITMMLQPIFTARADDGGRICAMAYLKIDDDGNIVARIKRVPIVGSSDEPFECPGGVPMSAPDVHPLPINDH